MSAKGKKMSEVTSVNTVVDAAISKQIKLQEAKRELFYFKARSQENSDEGSNDSEGSAAFLEQLRVASMEREQAIANLNAVLAGGRQC